MDILSEVYFKSTAENEKNLRFWENYLQNLKSLDFSVYSHKLKVPTLVPIGSRILFRGEIKHTNEVTVALGADYFVKCSIKQAEVLRQHRIKDAQSKLDIYIKEKEYLENQMSFTKKSLPDNQGKEIIEYYSEEDDKVWRQKHKENVRNYMQNRSKEETEKPKDITDEELWERLEELELQEELENELTNNDIFDNLTLTKIKESNKSFIAKEAETKPEQIIVKEKTDPEKQVAENKKKDKNVSFNVPSSKHELLQQVIDKQNELEEKLFELKNRERTQSKNETDLMSRLDELEQLDELEDEMDRLDDIIENEDDEDEEEEEEEEEDSMKTKATALQRRVSFVDEEYDSETLEITFDHSPVEPNHEAYDQNKGIQKPSDIYEAHSNLFGSGTTSILKKSKYDSPTSDISEITPPEIKAVQFGAQNNVEQQTIVVKDVVEKVKQDNIKLQNDARPTSLFKKKRMQNKS